jgi:hypothetical protein
MNSVQKWRSEVADTWRVAMSDESFKRRFYGNFVICFTVYMILVYWIHLNSGRPGKVIFDPVHALLPVYDFSPIIFFFTYSGVLIFLFHVSKYPELLHRGFTGFTVVFVMRAICIHTFPLSPPEGMIILHDPLLDNAVHENTVLNDLFFSGHVSDLSFFYFMSRDNTIKRLIFICGIMVGLFIVWQRVHYSFDVLAAPAFAYAAYWLFVEKDIIWSSVKKPITQ